ncbi:MAG: hypothetical protein C0483_01780 [Pirellula sp.]|nr:hypothetical protein [Pirellula sp.]
MRDGRFGGSYGVGVTLQRLIGDRHRGMLRRLLLLRALDQLRQGGVTLGLRLHDGGPIAGRRGDPLLQLLVNLRRFDGEIQRFLAACGR